MPRRRPGRVRGLPPPNGCTATRGLPLRTARALDRLEQPELSSFWVADALRTWRTVTGLSERVLSAPHNDWSEFVGPDVRGTLERAVRALDRRSGAPLRAELAHLDREFERKTSQNPFADPSLPWWARRWWH